MIEDSNNYLYYCSLIENKPWMIENKNVKEFLNSFLQIRIKGEYGRKLIQSIEKTYNEYRMKEVLNSHYHTIFIDGSTFKVKLFNNTEIKLFLIYVVGKKKNGKYDLLGIYYTTKNFSLIFEDINRRKVRRISQIISKKHNLEYIGKDLELFFKGSKLQCCLTNLNRIILKYSYNKQNSYELIDKVFSANTLNKANRILEILANINPPYQKKLILSYLPVINNLYNYKPKIRNVICTVNIISYIIQIITILLKEKTFLNGVEAIKYIQLTSEKILESGEYFIPNWTILTDPIE
jgi:transposase-like protein